MAKSMNSVCFTGYLGSDPRTHVFDDGTEVTNLSLAVSRQKKENGEFVDDTLWLEVRVSNTRARAIYERYGFTAVGVRKGYYPAVRGTREDAVVMRAVHRL